MWKVWCRHTQCSWHVLTDLVGQNKGKLLKKQNRKKTFIYTRHQHCRTKIGLSTKTIHYKLFIFAFTLYTHGWVFFIFPIHFEFNTYPQHFVFTLFLRFLFCSMWSVFSHRPCYHSARKCFFFRSFCAVFYYCFSEIA